MRKVTTTLLFALLSLLLIRCSNNSQNKASQQTVEKKDLIEYSVIDSTFTDTLNEIQITLKVLIQPSPSIKKSNLKDLLTYLYNDSKENENYNQIPNTIGIDIYTSNEKVKSGQWVASLSYSKITEHKPKIKIRETQFKSMSTNHTEKYGLTFQERKNIWNEKINLQDKAQKKADKKYPTFGDGFKKENFEKNSDLYAKLTAKYLKDLANRYDIKPSIIDSISAEGIKNGWALPEY